MTLVPAPTVVIFGAAVRPDGQPSHTLRRRVEAALAFGIRHAGTRYMPTGAQGRFGPPEAQVMADLLIAAGVTADAITQEPTGTDTLSSVLAVVGLVRGIHGPVFVATSAYHLPRCLVLLRLAGCPARACMPPAAPASQRFRMRWYWRLREVAALPWDVLLLLLRHRPFSRADRCAPGAD